MTTLSNNSAGRRRGRLRRRCRPRVEWLEDRTLLSSMPLDVLAGIAIPIALGTPTTGTLAAGDTIFYQVNPTAEGKLVAQVDAGGAAMRLALLNGQDQVLMQSDGQSPADPGPEIAVDVPAGPEYLELENLGGASTYTVTTALTPASAPFQPIAIPSDNPNNLPGFSPNAIVAGDFTGDGRTDLAVVNGGDAVSVLLGNGDGTFQPPVTYPVGNEPVSVVAGDFTGDGHTDLAVADEGIADPNTGAYIPGSGGVSVLLGNGDGTFGPQVTYPAGNGPSSLVAGDFTGDGHTDLAVTDYGLPEYDPNALSDLPVPGFVSVLLGNGDGTFQPPVSYAVGLSPYAITAGDFTGDGHTDLAVVNWSDNNSAVPVPSSNDISVLLGNGDGTFQPQVTYPVGNTPVAIAAGDFTGNGRDDLAVANLQDQTVSVLLSNADGTFQPQVTYAVGEGPETIVAGDFTGDGHTDLAVAGGGGTVSVLLGNGDGTFQPQVTCSVGGFPLAIVAGDFNGDGRLDLAVTNQGSNDVSVLLGNGDGTFQTPTSNPTGAYPYAAVAGDFNGDGRLDLAVVDNDSNDVSVLLGNGDGTFQPAVNYPVGGEPVNVVAGDFNGDGRTDLAVVDYYPGDVSVLLGNGDGTFQPAVNYPVGDYPEGIVAGDFNGDGRTDLAVTNYGVLDLSAFKWVPGTGSVSVLLGNGDGTFQPAVNYPVGDGPAGIVAGDFTGDGHTDLAVADSGFLVLTVVDNYFFTLEPSPGFVSVLLGNGDGTFQPAVNYPVGYASGGIAAGDFNGDGRTDLAAVTYTFDPNSPSTSDTAVSVLLGNGDGTFQPPVTYAEGPGGGFGAGITFQASVVAGDFTGDGHTDLAVANYTSGDVSVLLGNGDGTFQPPVTYAAGSGPDGVVAGDFNGDGRTDLAAVNLFSNDVSVLLNLGSTFAPAGSLVTTTQAAPVVADLTGDGVDDAFVVNAAGDILWRKGRPQEPGTYDPPVTINPGNPSREIVAINTTQGPMLASVDADDDFVSLYAWRSGSFALIGSLPTGSLPVQIAAADLTGDGLDDLVVRNAGDGTLSVFLNAGLESGPTTAPLPPFQPPIILPVGTGVSDVSLADVSGDGRTDIVVTDQFTGEVEVLRNLGIGNFAPAVFYPAGSGLYAVTSSGGPATVTTLEATAGVAAGALTPGGPADLVAIDTGSNTVSVLDGLGGGRFANPVTFPTATPAIQVLLADLEGNGVPDMIVLGDQGVTVYRGNGKGGFLPDPFTIGAGTDPTGMTLADVNGDGKLDLLIGNAYGDLLVLLGNGNGTFRPYRNADQDVALAILPNGSKTPDFIYADQGLDQVVVDYAGGQTNVVANRSSGLLVPGAVVLADLNGDGIPDLIVANSGGNDVLVYPGLGNGQFGPALGGGQGFAVGTNPVGITVANLNGRPDLVVANQGSNDVSILLNVATTDGGFTFIPGPRLAGGDGPVATVVTNVNGGAYPDLLISDSGSNQVRLLRGVGGGFFDDQDPTIFNVGTTPGPLFVGNFTGNPGQLDLVTVNSGSNNLSLVPDINGGNTVAQSIPSGGVFPIAAVEGDFGGPGGGGGNDLLVANNGDGHLALFLSGADGLNLAQTFEEPGLPNPTALAVAENGEVFADNEGAEAAIPVVLGLGGTSGATVLTPGPAEQQVVSLQPLSPTSLALIATLLSVPGDLAGEAQGQSATGPDASAGQGGGTTTAANQAGATFTVAVAPAGSFATSTSELSEAEAEAGAAAAPAGTVVAALPNQPAPKGVTTGQNGAGAREEAAVPGVPAKPQQPPTTVAHFIAGLDVSFARARLRARLGALWGAVTQTDAAESSSRTLRALLARWSPIVIGLGSPTLTLTLTVEIAQATLSAADRGAAPQTPAGTGTGATRSAAPSSPTEKTTAAEPSPQDVFAAAAGLSTVAWAHVHLVQPRSSRRPYRFQLRQSSRRLPAR